MTIIQLANSLQFIAAAALWSVVIFYLWPMTRLDSFRQKMFVLRDEMFDYATEGHISFDDPAYVLLRRQMNAIIRYGHQITFFRFALTTLYRKLCGYKRSQPGRYQEWQSSVELVPDTSARDSLKVFEERMSGMVMRRIIFGSPLLLSAACVLAVYILCDGATKTASQAMTAASRKLTNRFKVSLLNDAIQEAASS